MMVSIFCCNVNCSTETFCTYSVRFASSCGLVGVCSRRFDISIKRFVVVLNSSAASTLNTIRHWLLRSLLIRRLDFFSHVQSILKIPRLKNSGTLHITQQQQQQQQQYQQQQQHNDIRIACVGMEVTYF